MLFVKFLYQSHNIVHASFLHVGFAEVWVKDAKGAWLNRIGTNYTQRRHKCGTQWQKWEYWDRTLMLFEKMTKSEDVIVAFTHNATQISKYCFVHAWKVWGPELQHFWQR